MTQQKDTIPTEVVAQDGPQSILERALIEAYLEKKGVTWSDLTQLPAAEAKQLMIGATQYASLILAQHESTASFREKIMHPD